jgi:succinyl-CoA synthetase alpha subunit
VEIHEPLDFVALQDDPQVKMLVLLGEVGGVEEYLVCEAIKSGRINKPMVAWCIGTCGDMFTTDVQVLSSLQNGDRIYYCKFCRFQFHITFQIM